MVPLLISGGVLTASVLLFRAALPKQGGKRRWFIGTIWEPYVVVVLVTAAVVSLGFVAWSTVQLLR